MAVPFAVVALSASSARQGGVVGLSNDLLLSGGLALLGLLALSVAVFAALRGRGPAAGTLSAELREELRLAREESASQARHLREEVSTAQFKANEVLTASVAQQGRDQKQELERLAQVLREGQEALRGELQRIAALINEQLLQIRRDTDAKLESIRQSTEGKLTANEANQRQVGETLVGNVTTLAQSLRGELQKMLELQRTQLGEMTATLGSLTESSRRDQQAVREALEQRFAQIQASNDKKLEEMRQTVDEKLQGTLERRLGESFKLVSDRLEAVQRGLGEMKSLADGVGDLKRVLTNVKERGTWGEYQLGAILEQILTQDQFAQNVRPKEGGEVVEYAVKLPGKSLDGLGAPVWLPIDAKFPKEDYERLLQASEAADAEAVRAASLALGNAVKRAARDISEKYLSPPQTTDFAILFLPTEGLYAEVLRQPGLQDELQSKYHVMAAGPTTLSALLNSLRVGFRTLAIEQRSQEVWQVLGAVKSEFGKFGQVLEKVSKQLHTATKTLDQTHVRTRAMERKLRSVEQMPSADAQKLLALSLAEEPADVEETDVPEEDEES